MYKNPAVLTLLAALTAAAQTLPSPGSLKADSATKSEVALSWITNSPDATAYIVERKPLDGTFASIATVPKADKLTYTDKTIDAFTTYTYRVRATQQPNNTNTSDPSNEITVGPPPVGTSMMVPHRDLGQESASDFGRRPSIALDANGDPAVAYFNYAPNTDRERSFVEFRSWNRAQYRWNDVVSVAVVGDAEGGGPGATLHVLARDPATNTWGLATQAVRTDNHITVRLYISKDNGLTWTMAQDFRKPEDTNFPNYPSLAMNKGVGHISMYVDNEGMLYLSGNLTDSVDKWTTKVAPIPPGADSYRQYSSLALDSEGNPAIAYIGLDGSYNSVVALWRPKTGALTRIMDSNVVQNDESEIKLAFAGTRARVAVRLVRDDQGPSGYDRFYWVSAEENGSFLPPVGIQADGNSSLGYLSFDIGSKSQAALVSAITGGNWGDVKCGAPKLIRSDNLQTWTNCAPYGSQEPPWSFVDWPQVLFAANDRLYIALTDSSPDSKTFGIVLWRE